jgi:hypothetical protein
MIRHRNNPDTCGACSNPAAARPPRAAIAAALSQHTDPEASP